MSNPGQRLRCAFLFRWPYNPYLNLLADELRRLGVDVQIPDRCLWFASRVRKHSHVHIVHLQEIAPLFLATTLPKSVVKSFLSLAQLVYLKFCGTRIVWTAHDLKTHWERYPRLERLFTTTVAALAGAIVTHCQGAARAVAARFHVRAASKIVSMPHGNYIGAYPNRIDRSTAQRHFGISSDVLTLLCFGLIRPYKGFDNLLDAFVTLPESQIHLIIAGKPFDEHTALRARRRVAGHRNITLVPEFIADNDVQVYMSACDAVIFTYREILTSGAVILAMSFGKACIAPRKGCIPEVLDSQGAFLYEGDSTSELRASLQQAIARRDRLAAMGEYNRAKVAHWSWSQIATATLDVYRSVLPKGAVVLCPSDGSREYRERGGQKNS